MKKHPQDYVWSSIEKLLSARTKTESMEVLQQYLEAGWNPFAPQKGKYQSTVLKCFLNDIYGWDDFWLKNVMLLEPHIKSMLKDSSGVKELDNILGHAIGRSNVKMTKLLVDCGVNVHGSKEPPVGSKEPPSSKSVIYSAKSAGMVKYLKSVGAAVDVQNENAYLWLRCVRDVMVNGGTIQELEMLEEYIPAYIPKEVPVELSVLGFQALNSGLQSIATRLSKLDGAERLFSLKKSPKDSDIFLYINKILYPEGGGVPYGALDLPEEYEIKKRKIEEHQKDQKYDGVRFLSWCKSIFKIDRPYAIDILVDVFGKDYVAEILFDENLQKVSNEISLSSNRGYYWEKKESEEKMIVYLMTKGVLKTLNRLIEKLEIDDKKVVDILSASQLLSLNSFEEKVIWSIFKNIKKSGAIAEKDSEEKYKSLALKLLYLTQLQESNNTGFSKDKIYTNSSYKWLVESGLNVSELVKIEVGADEYFYYLKNNIYPSFIKGVDISWGKIVDPQGAGKELVAWQEGLRSELCGLKRNVTFEQFKSGFVDRKERVCIEVSVKSLLCMHEQSGCFEECALFGSLDKLKSLVEASELKLETSKVLKQLKTINGAKRVNNKHQTPRL